MKLTLLLLLLPFLGTSQTVTSNNTLADINYVFNSYSSTKEASPILRQRFPVHTIQGRDYVSFLGIVSSAYNEGDLKTSGALVGSRIKDIVSFKYPLDRLDELTSETGFIQLEMAGMIKPMLNKVPADVRADSVWAGYGLPESYTGDGIIIGVTDWGFDYSSPMFYDTLLNDTRIVAAWDQFKTSGPAPTGYSYGTEFNTLAEFQAAGSDTSNIYSYSTHGTHVSGIAGGSGAGTQYRGIAFEANYLFTTFLVDEASVLDAWQWMYERSQAEGKRLVINMSWGLYHMGAIDGTSILSQALDSYSDLNVVFVTSAGNNGEVNFHIQHDYSADTLNSRVNFYSSGTLASLWGQSIHMWGEAGNEFVGGFKVLNGSNVVIGETPDYSTATTGSYVDSFIVVNATDTVWYNLSADNTYPSNGRPQIRMRIKIPPAGLKIVMKSSAATGKVHYWNVTELSNDVGNWGMPFTTSGTGTIAGDDEYGIGTPACSGSAITVAAYSAEYDTGVTIVGGQPAYFTSIGPIMTETMKPDIAGPGLQVGSSISSYTDASYTQITSIDFNGRTYPFAKFSGTSMSSPVVAGVVALILDANHYLSAAQVKDIIKQTARFDSHTGIIPSTGDPLWGWGKINAYSAIQLALVTTGLNESLQSVSWTLFPNPAVNVLSISEIEGVITSIQIIDQSGRLVLQPADLELIDISSLETGSYLFRIVNNGKVEQKPFVKI
ncbi:MAG: minor extracellular serine protease Vpr [Flavobacteriaceae bacterium]|jgi:minor extracellular serine protease Vpr